MADELYKGSALDCAQGSRIVHRGRCKVFFFGMATTGAADIADLYDGTDANGKRKDRIASQGLSADDHSYGRGVYFDNGVFVNVVAGTPFVTVQFEALPDVPGAP